MILALALLAQALLMAELAHLIKRRPVTRAASLLAAIASVGAFLGLLGDDPGLLALALPVGIGASTLALALLLHGPRAPLLSRRTITGDDS